MRLGHDTWSPDATRRERYREKEREREKRESEKHDQVYLYIWRDSNVEPSPSEMVRDARQANFAESVPRGAMTFLETMTKQHARYDYLCLDGCNIGDLDIPRHETLSTYTYLLVRKFQKSGYTAL